MAPLDHYISMLRDGHDADTVLTQMRQRYHTEQCLRTKTAYIRAHYDGPMREGACSEIQTLHTYARNDAEHAALDEWAESYGRRRWKPTSNEMLDTAVSGMRLLPENVDRLRITKDEVKECKRCARVRRHERAKSGIRVNGDLMVRHVRSVMRTPDAHGLYEVVLCMLLASGRRTTEILNGRSKFTATADDSWVTFEGQLKCRGPRESYVIPLAVSTDSFLKSLESLRRRQGDRVRSMTNEQISSRYQSGLRSFLLHHPVFSEARTVHGLRGVYVWLMYNMYDWGDEWVSYVAHKILGHSDVAEAMSYLPFHVSIHGVE